MLLLGIRHQRQQQADCLVACAAIVLDYLGVAVDEARLRRLLGTTEDGTPFPNITRLQTLGLFVTYGKDGDLSLFERAIEVGLPIIIGAKTLTWTHWGGEVTRHAVVVVGIDPGQGDVLGQERHVPHGPAGRSALDIEQPLPRGHEQSVGHASPS